MSAFYVSRHKKIVSLCLLSPVSDSLDPDLSYYSTYVKIYEFWVSALVLVSYKYEPGIRTQHRQDH